MSVESGTIDLIVQLINQVGFPIFVVLWFMYRSEKIIKANTQALGELTTIVAKLCEKLNEHDDDGKG